MSMIEAELINGHVLTAGLSMPRQDILDVNVYDNINAYMQNEPIYIASSYSEAVQWVNGQPTGRISQSDYAEVVSQE